MECCRASHHHKNRRCECHEHKGLRRRFISSAERQERLEAYREELRKELTGVEEALSKLASE